MRKILVTGGAGYLGSQVTEKLLQQGYEVRILDNLSFGDSGLRLLKKKYQFELVKGDVRDLQTVLNCLEGTDAVIHLAAIVGDPASSLDPIRSLEINSLSTKLVADAAKYFKIKQFIFASSCSVYGASKNKILTESSKLSPVSLYAQTKIRSENVVLDANGKSFSPTIFRTATLFGYSNRMRFDLVINLFTVQALFEGKISIEGGNQWRPFLHVSDAAEAYVLAIEKPTSKSHGIYNLGYDEYNYQLNKIGEFIKGSIPDVKIRYSDVMDKRNYRVSFSKLKKSLGLKCTKSVSDGIKEIKAKIKNKTIKSWKNPIYYNNKLSLCMGKSELTKYYWK